MKKKILSIVTIMLVIGTSISITAATNTITHQLDQCQDEHGNDVHEYISRPICSQFSWAQSFVPTMSMLTKINLLIFTWESNSNPLTISIRKELTGSEIANVTIRSNDIPSAQFTGKEWTNINIGPILVDVNEPYYIVATAPDAIWPGFCWVFGEDTSYTQGAGYIGSPEGDQFISIEEKMGVSNDFCFKTYGINFT